MMECFCVKPRVIQLKIILLDEQEIFHEVQDSQPGQALLDVVFRHLNLLEAAYFGLRFVDPDGQTHWLDANKKISQQLKGPGPFNLYFGVKFYAADPCKLLEEITRYQFFLQIKQDVLQGRLPVTFDLAAELGAYIVQSELGDYDPRRHSPGYVSEFRFLSNQTVELENRIAELHKTLVGQLPSVAELKYLDKIKWLDMYGVDLHPVMGEDSVEYYLGLTPSGIIVLRNKSIVGNYYWPRISKIYFKGKYFMLKVTDKNNDENTFGFESPTKVACKHLWKCCLEHHGFFRLVQVSPTTTDIFSLGSRFTYQGRTEKQIIKDAQSRLRSPPTFSRFPSRRYQRRIVDGASDSPKVEDVRKHHQPQEIKHISIPQPAQSYESSYKGGCSSNAMYEYTKPDSPRSTRSAPWSQPHTRGLYNVSVPPSPRSVHSAGPRYRSSSIDSQSSNDSRSTKRRKNHRSRWTSDNESELSKSSSRSHRKHRRHRSRSKKDSGSEQDIPRRRRSSSRRLENHYELIDSGSQWQEVQKKQEGTVSSIQQANVISSNRRSSYISNHLDASESASASGGSHRRRRSSKHRHQLYTSPDSKSWLPEELKKHLEFDLIDTSGMSEQQLKEIPYTVVQTNHAKQLKLKQAWSKSESSQQSDKLSSYSPPPPYSPKPENGVKHGKTMRHNNHNPSVLYGLDHQAHSDAVNSSVSSLALPRMFDSLTISDAANYVNTRGQRNGNNNYLNQKCSSESTSEPRVQHEHTDSGLGVDQDSSVYLYNDRSFDGGGGKHDGGNRRSRYDHHGIMKHATNPTVLNPYEDPPTYGDQRNLISNRQTESYKVETSEMSTEL